MTAILGVDPGPTPGVVLVTTDKDTVTALQVFDGPPLEVLNVAMELADWVAVERFIIGRATIRRTRAGSNLAHAQAVAVHDAAKAAGKPVQYLPAGQVKPWATDARLKRYGLWDALKGPHQRDAARHALVMAVKHGALPVLV